jgi:hypothetical protein
MPAGLKKMVLASSATAAVPAKALPKPLAFCTSSRKAAAAATPENPARVPVNPIAIDKDFSLIFIGSLLF